MSLLSDPLESATTRRVFPHWSIVVPDGLSETFVAEDRYWHAWDEHRSVSLSSIVITDRGRPVSEKRILRRMRPPMAGVPIAMPPSLSGWALEIAAEQPARASRAVSGMIATKGRVLLATVTSDDTVWAASVWLSIRYHAVPVEPGPR